MKTLSRILGNGQFLFKLIIIDITVIILLIFLTVFVLINQSSEHQKYFDAGKRRYESYLLADQLRQSSDDLTRMVRSYAATGDKKFKQFFWDIVDIRDGRKKRPTHYERVYWDFLAVPNGKPPFEFESNSSLESLMKIAGFTEDEFNLLAEAKHRSDELIKLESESMDLIDSIYLKAGKELSIEDRQKKEEALKILYGEQYHRQKKYIMEPINAFYKELDERTREEVWVAENKVRIYNMILNIVFLSTVLLGGVLISTIYLYHKRMIESQNRALDLKTDEINHRKKVEKELIVAMRNAEAADRAKSEFLSNISHEFRTPLHQIISYAQIGKKALNKGKLEKLPKFFDNIMNISCEFLPFLSDLLDLSNLDSGKMVFDMTKNDLARITNTIVSDFQIAADKRGIAIEFKKATDRTLINCDSQKIIQVIRNLLSNALKFSPNDSIIIVSLSDVSDLVEPVSKTTNITTGILLKVSDNGIGVPENELEKIFDKFSQSSKTKSGAGGKGLGLAISREIIEAHNGAIWAQNNPEGGTTFYVVLPSPDGEEV